MNNVISEILQRRRIKRVDVDEKVRGMPIYAADLEFPGLLHGATVRSTRPHARIVSLDLSEALELEGVVAILTASDVQGRNRVPELLEDMPFLAEGVVRYVGEPIAIVVARDRATARRAAELVKVEYEDLPAVFDPLESVEEGAPQVAVEGEDPLRNVFATVRVCGGDVEEGKRASERVVEGEFRIPSQEHLYLEPITVIAVPSGRGVEVLGPFQAPHQDYVQRMVAAATGLPLSRVRVKVTTIGGSFGGKEDVPGVPAAHAAVAALRLGRPVMISYDREEDFISTSKRHEAVVRMELGADGEGKITFMRAKIWLDSGAYATLSPAVLWLAAVMACVPYRIPNVEIEGYAVATNKVPRGAFRGFGNPQVSIPRELLLDELAEVLGVGPEEIRLKNLVSPGDRLCFGQEVGVWGGAKAVLEALLRSERVRNLLAFGRVEQDGRILGVGLSTVAIPIGLGATGRPLERAGAVVELKRDGSLSLRIGSTEMGTGAHTAMVAIASEILGVPPERIEVAQVDTSAVPDSGPTVASRSAAFQGRAVALACERLARRLRELASRLLGAEEVRFEDSMVVSERGYMTIRELAERAYEEGVKVWEEAHVFSPPGLEWDFGSGRGVPYPFYSHAAQLTLVSLDPETGEVEVIEVHGAYDVGPVLFPEGAESQVQGGTVMGIGYALMEELVQEDGRILNPNFTDYLIPTAMDVPRRMEITFVEDYPSGLGPPGAKGLGELPFVASSASVACAVARALDKKVRKLPLTPENIWKIKKNF